MFMCICLWHSFISVIHVYLKALSKWYCVCGGWGVGVCLKLNLSDIPSLDFDFDTSHVSGKRATLLRCVSWRCYDSELETKLGQCMHVVLDLKIAWNSIKCNSCKVHFILTFLFIYIFSSHEHNVLRMNYSDCLSSVVCHQQFACEHSKGYFAQSSPNLFRMLTYMRARTSSKLGYIGSKSRSLGQITIEVILAPPVTVLLIIT